MLNTKFNNFKNIRHMTVAFKKAVDKADFGKKWSCSDVFGLSPNNFSAMQSVSVFFLLSVIVSWTQEVWLTKSGFYQLD